MAKKRLLVNPVGVAGRDLSLAQIRALAKTEPEAFVRKIEASVADGELNLSQMRDVRGLYAALADVPVNVTIPDAAGVQRAITTSAFPVLMGNTVVAAINDAYEAVPTVGEQLVTELDDDQAITVVARIGSENKHVDQVKELEEFPEIGVSEETVQIPERRNGRRITLSAEAVSRNDIAGFVDRVNALGVIAAETVEELTVDRVTDLTGSGAASAAPYVYRPAGSGTALFSTTADTPGTRAPSGTRINTNVLQDGTDLEVVRARMLTMRNDRGKPIVVNPNEYVCLVPGSLEHRLFAIKNTELVLGSANNDVSSWGPRGQYAGWSPVVSQFLDLHSVAAWYFGAPRRQFRRKWALRFEYVTLGESTQEYLTKRVAFQARVAWNVEVGATDYVYWVQSLPSTTPPSK